MAKQSQKVKLTGKVVYFQPNKRSDFSTAEQPKYEIELCNVEDFPQNKDTLAMLDAMGAKIRKEGTGNDTKGKYEERGRFISSRSNYPIVVIDAERKRVPEDLPIGNGSVVNALFEVYPLKKDPNYNFGLGVRRVQLVELVPYEKTESKEDAMASLFDVVEGGYVAPDEFKEDDSSGSQTTESDDLDDEIPF